MSDWKTLKETASFQKGGEQIVARIVQGKDMRFLDLRTHYLDDSGNWKPTRRGLAIPEDLLEDLRSMVNGLCDEANELREAGQ